MRHNEAGKLSSFSAQTGWACCGQRLDVRLKPLVSELSCRQHIWVTYRVHCALGLVLVLLCIPATWQTQIMLYGRQASMHHTWLQLLDVGCPAVAPLLPQTSLRLPHSGSFDIGSLPCSSCSI